jgi:signal recognition particle subunit SEC65
VLVLGSSLNLLAASVKQYLEKIKYDRQTIRNDEYPPNDWRIARGLKIAEFIEKYGRSEPFQELSMKMLDAGPPPKSGRP